MAASKIKANAKLVKAMNRELILEQLKIKPKQSRAEISKQTNLSRPCVSELVKEMIEEGLVHEVGSGTSKGGRKPILLEYNAKSSYVVGVMFEGSKMMMTLSDMNGDWIKTIERSFLMPAEGPTIVHLIQKGIYSLVESVAIDFSKILGLAVGVPGITSEAERKIGYSPGVEWLNIDLKQELVNRLSMDVIIENDVNMMTYGEYFNGYGKGVMDFVYLFVGNGIGSGLIVNGKFLKGFHSAAGEIGHMMIGNQKNKRKQMGVFESNYGLFGIEKILSEQEIPINNQISLIENLQSLKDNRDLNKILDEILFNWAKATINITSVIDPQVIVLSGEMTKLNSLSFNRFIDILESYLPQVPEIRITKLGSKAGLYGAVHHALEHFSKPAIRIN